MNIADKTYKGYGYRIISSGDEEISAKHIEIRCWKCLAYVLPATHPYTVCSARRECVTIAQRIKRHFILPPVTERQVRYHNIHLHKLLNAVTAVSEGHEPVRGVSPSPFPIQDTGITSTESTV